MSDCGRIKGGVMSRIGVGVGVGVGVEAGAGAALLLATSLGAARGKGALEDRQENASTATALGQNPPGHCIKAFAAVAGNAARVSG